ncbi:MAG: M50 family metallopeptidase [bacterium]|nr:M50 family metallopeptidase [bacterium]
MLSFLGTTLLFLFILSVLVIIHELGHFVSARFFGVHVEEFGIGFPPRATSFTRGKTLYSINWLPLGGFVKLKGEQGEGQQDSDSFAAKPIWQRVIILGAGVFMNLLLTVVIFTIGFAVGMPQAVDDGAAAQAKDVHIEITNVLAKSPAAASGIQPGDVIAQIDSHSFQAVSEVQKYVREHAGVPVVVDLLRGKDAIRLTATPVTLKENGLPGLGIGLARVGTISYPIHIAFVTAIQTTAFMTVTIITTLFNAIRHFAFEGFVGPVGIAATTATVTKLGISYLLNLVAQLSLSLAIFNFLPIPALDGGRAWFAILEKVRGRSLDPAFENMIHVIGFVLLIALLILVTFRDIAHLLSV